MEGNAVLSKAQGGNPSLTQYTRVTMSNEDFYDRNVIVKKKMIKKLVSIFALLEFICFLIHALNKPVINLEPCRKEARLPFSP